MGKVETDEQTIVNLAKLQRGYLSRTMEWLTSRKIIISENMPQLKYVRKIVDIIPFSYSTPAPIICSITEDHTFRYSIIRFNADTKVWCIDSDLKEITKGNSIGTIEAVKTVSDILAPFSGKIIEINKTLSDSPELVNSDPYGEGWMIKAEIANPSEINDLLDAASYKALIGQ